LFIVLDSGNLVHCKRLVKWRRNYLFALIEPFSAAVPRRPQLAKRRYVGLPDHGLMNQIRYQVVEGSSTAPEVDLLNTACGRCLIGDCSGSDVSGPALG
jgi:hypothetical protein